MTIALLVGACSSGSEKPRTGPRNGIAVVTPTDAAPSPEDDAPTAPAVPLPGVDRLGDPLPLPARVSAQLGTLRLHHGSGPTWVDWSPDGTELVTAGEQAIRIWSVSDGRLVRTLTASSLGLGVAAMSPDGEVVVGGLDKIVAWDKTGEERWRIDVAPEELMDLAFSPDGKLVAAATMNNVRYSDGPPPSRGLWLLEAATGKEILDLESTYDPPDGSVAFSPDGKLVAISGNGTHVYDVASGKRVVKAKGGGPNAVFTPDNRAILWAEDFDVVRFDRKTKKEKRRRLVKDDEVLVEAFALSPDGAALLAFREGKLHFLDPATLADLRVVDTTTAWTNHASFSADGKRVALASETHGVLMLDGATGALEVGHPGHGTGVSNVAFSADGARVVTGGVDGKVLVWDLGGEVVATAPAHGHGVTGLSFSVDGTKLASCGKDGRVIVSQVTDGAEVARVTVPEGPCHDVLFLPDGRVLIAPGNSPGLVWTPGAAAPEEMPYEIGEGFESLARSRDGKLVLASYFILDASTLELIREVEVRDYPRVAAFSNDDALLLIGHARGLDLVEVATGKALSLLGAKPHTGVAWAPDDGGFATAHEGGAAFVRLDRATWKATADATLDFPDDPGTHSVAISPDGARIVTGHDNGVALIWSAASR